jgi:dolichol-phosphate mannosyltransferase
MTAGETQMSERDPTVFFSVIIPAHNEEDNIAPTCDAIVLEFERERVADYEILVVNDNSADATETRLRELCGRHPRVRYVNNTPPHGFGFAVRRGLEHFRGEAACVVMADLSDAPADIVRYYRKMKEGWECVFGSRFMKGGRVIDYPGLKLILNRCFNGFIKTLFRVDHNDITNAFKCYRRNVIEGVQPLLSHHFNLTVELPLKAIVRGYTWTKLPISWTNRAAGVSKLKLKEMGSRYMFIVLYVFLEKMLSKGDYVRPDARPPAPAAEEPPHGR